MRQVLDDQKYLDFSGETSLKVVEEYRAKYAWIDKCLDENELSLWLAHEDLESLSASEAGREAKFTTENMFFQNLNSFFRRSHISSAGTAKRFSKRAGDDINFSKQVKMFVGATSALAENTDTMRIVNDQHRVVLFAKLDNLGQQSDIRLEQGCLRRIDQLFRGLN